MLRWPRENNHNVPAMNFDLDLLQAAGLPRKKELKVLASSACSTRPDLQHAVFTIRIRANKNMCTE